MQKIETVEQYTAAKKAAEGTLGLIVHFSASWCDPCKAVNDFLEKQAEAYESRLLFVEVDCEKLGGICEREGVESVPFIAFFRTPRADDMRSVERVADIAGAKLDLIDMNIRSLYGENGGKGIQREDFPSLVDYLKYLTTRKGVVMFITGSPSRPRCGFTGRLCELVLELGVPFTYYDVMASNEVCEGLKTYANWPTYPQVYVDGELIGGWDICRELNEEGELKATLKH